MPIQESIKKSQDHLQPNKTNEQEQQITSQVIFPSEFNLNTLKIKNATKKGFLEAEDGDGIDISSRMESHRGTVQKAKAQTLTTMGGENVGVVIKQNVPNKVEVVGNYSPSNHNASRIVSAGGGSSNCNGKSWDNNCDTRETR